MKSSKMEVPKISLGTWLMGGTKEPNPQNDDQKDISVIHTAIENGITTIDTAQNYAAGRCEEIVGEAIKKYPRTAYQILTKQNKEYLSYSDVIEGCQQSMERMGIDYIDYFVCHAPNPKFDTQDFFKAANKLFKDGFIKGVGISNFGPRNIEIAVKTSELPILFNQVHFSIDDDDIVSTGTYDSCLKYGIKIQSYRSLVSIDENKVAQPILKEIANKYSITRHQVVLAYLNSYKDVVFTIRASSKMHWDEIKEAMQIKLDKEDIQKIKVTHTNKEGNFRQYLLI
jgi:diketogulonate reductase-like aldo/keto reductase